MFDFTWQCTYAINKVIYVFLVTSQLLYPHAPPPPPKGYGTSALGTC